MKTKKIILDIILLFIGVISAGFGLRGFLLPNNFIDGGAVGISLLITEVSGFPLPVLLILVNIPFILLGTKAVSKDFALKTVICILLLALAVAFFPYPQITSDKLLVSVFGGFFLGTGIGLAVRGGGVIDGTEVLALLLSKKTGLSIGDIIFIINIVIFSTAAYLLSVETALYSILTYLAASKSVDFVIQGIEEYLGVTIISDKSEKVRLAILNDMGNGVTIFKGEKGFSKQVTTESKMDILYTVLSRLEVSKLKDLIDEIDPGAFVTMHSVKDTKGGIIKKKFKK